MHGVTMKFIGNY